MSTTTTDNLPKAPPALSLSPSAASFDFSKPFTLVSADGHSFSVDPLKLAGTSSVFADMLSSGGGDRTCTLSEKNGEVEEYIKAVETGICGGEVAAALFRMADKYDAPIVRSALARYAWTQLRAHPLFTYGVGYYLQDKTIMSCAAEVSLEMNLSGHTSRLFNSLDAGGKAVLLQNLYRSKVFEAARRSILQAPVPTSSCAHIGVEHIGHAWTGAVHAALRTLDFGVEPDALVRSQLRLRNSSRPNCSSCIQAVEDALDAVAAKWRSPSTGKNSIKLFD